MAKMNRWTSPLHITTLPGARGPEPGKVYMNISVKPRRWHPAWWWLVIQHVEPRYLWRPDAWVAIVRAGLLAGR